MELKKRKGEKGLLPAWRRAVDEARGISQKSKKAAKSGDK